MNGKDFKGALAKECQLTQREAGTVLNAVIKLIKQELAGGGSLTLTGLGKFYTAPYSRKTITTPQGEKLEIKPHNVARFNPCKELKDIVAGRV